MVVKHMNRMHIVPIGAIVGPAHLVRTNAGVDRLDSIWLVNNHVDFDTHWTVYSVRMSESRCEGI